MFYTELVLNRIAGGPLLITALVDFSMCYCRCNDPSIEVLDDDGISGYDHVLKLARVLIDLSKKDRTLFNAKDYNTILWYYNSLDEKDK